jgi:hypothetical protein
LANGYEATVLADLCEAILAARSASVLQKQQEHVASQAEILVRGFARIGIIALVDEATGYQRDRAKDALAKLLEAWVAKELQVWVQTFPREFYEHMFRLRGLEFASTSVKRPQYFGHLTNDIVYKRLEAGVLKELKRVTPRNEAGRPMARYTQSLTKNIGYPKLKEHLGAVVAFMRISKSWNDFMNLLNEHYPRKGDTRCCQWTIAKRRMTVRDFRDLSLIPTTFCGFLGDSGAALWCHLGSPRNAALLAERFRGRVFAVVSRQGLSFLAGRDAHDFDGVADDVCGALRAFRTVRHQLLLFT